MTDLPLTMIEEAPARPKRRGQRALLITLPVLLALAGGAAGFLGLWSPLSLAGLAGGNGSVAMAKSAFVDVPAIDVTLPDPRPRMLHLVVKLETTESAKSQVEHLLPRFSDAFNTFLTSISPQAFDRRGILEVIREEMNTRARLAAGPDIPIAVLLTEFALK